METATIKEEALDSGYIKLIRGQRGSYGWEIKTLQSKDGTFDLTYLFALDADIRKRTEGGDTNEREDEGQDTA